MSAGGSMNKSSNQSEFNSDVSDVQAPYLQDLWAQGQDWVKNNQGDWDDMLGIRVKAMDQGEGQAQDIFAQNMQGATGAQNAQLGGGAFQGQGSVYDQMGLAQGLTDSLQQSMNNPSAMQDINSMIMGGSGNNYADAMKDQYTQDASRAQEMMLANTDARAAASGVSGGSRHGMQQGMGNEAITKELQSNLAQTGFNTFDKDLDRKLNIAQQADQGTLARQGMMQNMLGNQQGTLSGNLGQTNAAQQYGLGNLGSMNQQASGGMNINDQYNQNIMNTQAQKQQPISWLGGLMGSPIMASSGDSSGKSFGMGGSAGK